MKLPISVIIHTKNSAKTLPQALDSAAFAQELIVVDMESQDATHSIAKKYGVMLVSHPDVGIVEPARMFGISQATQPWVFLLDADEEIPPALVGKLEDVMKRQEVAWKIPRKNLMFGLWPKYAAWWPDYVVRFFRKGKVEWPKEIHAQPKVSGEVGELPADEQIALIHHNYQTISDYVQRLDHYSTISAAQDSKGKTSSLDAFIDDFLRKYFLLGGHQNGILGLHVCLLQAMYESVLAMKRWELQGKPAKKVDVNAAFSKVIEDMAYWRADYMVQQTSGLSRLYWQLRKKGKW